MTPEIAERVARGRAEKEPIALVTRLADGGQCVVTAGTVEGSLALGDAELAEVRHRIDHNNSGLIGDEEAGDEAGDESRLFVHVHTPPLRLLVVGAVHIAQALVPMAALAGYAVHVIDPRRAFATDDRFPNVTMTTEWPDDALPALKADRRTAIVTLTHDPKLDDPALLEALKSDAFYIGALGSKRTHAKRWDRLKEEGVGEASFARINGPIGLNIGALTPAEIAVSILGQITATLRADRIKT
ncbi:MAG: XdhC family protein [Alphaproteobacteria bacterium]|nr:XdhC family protein [Alphaproteobacteria bacterium]